MIWTADDISAAWPVVRTGDAVVAYLAWHEWIGAFDWEWLDES